MKFSVSLLFLPEIDELPTLQFDFIVFMFMARDVGVAIVSEASLKFRILGIPGVLRLGLAGPKE